MKKIPEKEIREAVKRMQAYNKKHKNCENLIYNGKELVCECEYEKSKRPGR